MTFPWKVSVSLVSVRVIVAALTAPLKFTLSAWVIVRVPALETEVPEMSLPSPLPAFSSRLNAAPVTAPRVMSLPSVTLPALVVSTTELPARVTAPRRTASPLVRTLPLRVVVLAVLVSPPSKRNSSPPLPSVTPPVLEKVTALVTWLLAPSKTTA